MPTVLAENITAVAQASAPVSGARHGFGTQIGWAAYTPTGTADVFARFAEVRSIGGPEESITVSDVKHLLSPFAYVEKIPGFIDAGEIPMTLNFNTSDAAVAEAQVGPAIGSLGGKRRYLIELPKRAGDTTKVKILFRGFISKWKIIDVPEDGVIAMDITITVDSYPLIDYVAVDIDSI